MAFVGANVRPAWVGWIGRNERSPDVAPSSMRGLDIATSDDMRLRRPLVVSAACAAFASARPACADSPPPDARRALALGFNLDLLPTVLSAANGKLGYAPQIWVGIDRVRIRFVGSHLEPPDAFAFAPKGFREPTTTAFASIVDYTFGPRFDRWWVGSGFEVWEQTIKHDDVTGKSSWTSIVFTVGAGYIWRFAGDFFIDPWVGAHAVLNPQTVSSGAFDYKPFPLQGEASLKLGWFTSL
jgi:hypothetical protein